MAPPLPPEGAPHALPEDLRDALVPVASRAGVFATHLQWFARVGSTNDVVRDLAARAAPEGTVVVADAQDAGRGRLGRPWASPAGAGLYCSLLLRPERPIPALTLAVGVAVAQAVRLVTGVPVELKWPNDIYRGHRKLAGILAEGGNDAHGPFVVVGVGINVNRAAYPADVADKATALEDELGQMVNRWTLCAHLLAAFGEVYDRARQGGTSDVLAEWRRLARPFAGRPVEWDERGRRRTGVAKSVDDLGALVVESADGECRLVGGEVRWV